MASPANRREWEDRLVQTAAYFTCSVPVRGPRQRGQRLQWAVARHASLAAAVMDARRAPTGALVYAVAPSGDSTPLGPHEWDRALQLRGEVV